MSYSLQAAIGNSGRTDDELEHLSTVIEPRQRDSASLNSAKVSNCLGILYLCYVKACLNRHWDGLILMHL